MRRARVEISIEGTDVSMDIAPHLLSLTYTDKADDELDDFQFTLEDRDASGRATGFPNPAILSRPKSLPRISAPRAARNWIAESLKWTK